MDISQALDIIEKEGGWFRLEHMDKTTQAFFGFDVSWAATVSAVGGVGRPREALGATALEVLVALVREIEKCEIKSSGTGATSPSTTSGAKSPMSTRQS